MNFVPDFVGDCVDSACPECWKDGCGLNGAFGMCADCLEVVTPCIEQVGNAIWIFGSPLAFPLIFCFPSDPHTNESSGYEISMLQAPLKRPCTCCAATILAPCAQWHLRRRVLGNDMTKYKLWQGFHDGPKCCATRCPSAPITIEAGTYREQECPNAFLMLEVCCLGGMFSICCAHDVSRRYQRQERGLGIDPTEHRQQSCIQFFSKIMQSCFKMGCCMCISSCLLTICAPDSEGAQELAGETGRAARACCRIAHTIWRGIIWTRIIGMGCTTTQMLVEADHDYNSSSGPKKCPDKMIMERGIADDNNVRIDPTTQATEINDMKMPWDDANAPQTQRMNQR